METANKLIHKSSKSATTGRIGAEDTGNEFESIVPKLRGMNTVYAKQQHRQNPEEKKMTFKEIQ